MTLLYALVFQSAFEYRRASGSRRYSFGVTATRLYFVRAISYPNGPPPTNETGILSMGHALVSQSFYFANWDQLYQEWLVKVKANIDEIDAIDFSPLPEIEPLDIITSGRGASVLAVIVQCLCV